MTEMRVVEIRGPECSAEGLALAKRPRPEPAAGEVRIEVMAAGVNRPDILQRQGRYPVPAGASDLPGLEVAGMVSACGDQVERWKVGDPVCALTEGGGYAEEVCVPAGQVLPVPAGLSMAEAAALPETFFTVYSMVFMEGAAQPGERLLVHGASSGVGSAAICMAGMLELRVAGTVGHADKEEACRALGADRVWVRDESLDAKVGDWAGADGLDLVLDMLGGAAVARHQRWLGRGGRHLSVAFLEGRRAEVDLARLMSRRQRLIGATLRPRPAREKAAIAAALERRVWPLMAAGAPRPPIHAQFPLAEAWRAHAELDLRRHIGKVVLEVQPGR